ncbi:MAG: polysaccharide deacetylase family protein [Chitinispirillaceae bacterium]|nr:polysaccharide deacetylase family protein [Chitinispirillaceae bacterium]
MCWSISLGAWFIAWLTVPSLRPFTAAVLLLHLPVLVAGVANLHLGFFCPALCTRGGEKRRLALTFDDGPEPNLTPAILDLLGEFNFRATFFCIARRVEKHPAVARLIVTRGHTIACHDLDHQWTANLRRHRRMVADINEACSIIRSVTGISPRCYRPPVGLSNPHLRTALAHLDMVCIGWSRSLGDAGNRFAGRLRRMPRLAEPGAVIMLHDCLPAVSHRDVFLQQLRMLCERIREKELTSVGVDELFGVTPYR